MKKMCALILLGGIVWPCASRAVDFKQAKFTQIVNNVEVVSSDNTRHPAGVNDVFKMPDVVRTGPASRAELIALDNTITRVGANTIFSFDPANRTIDLQQGSLLFHSPHGKGGGTIHTGSATASVLGTTVIITTTPNGGFKVLVLEGEAEIRFLNGLRITLTPGQMTFVLPGGGTSPIVVFRLDDETKGSLLVSGFNNPLPSWLKIDTEITRQLLLLLNNKLQDVDLVVGDNATPNAVQVRMDLLTGTTPTPFDTDSSIISVDKTAYDPLPVNYPPLDPAHVISSPFSPPNIPSFSEGLVFLGISSPASGFVGKNIDIDTGTESSSTDYIDVSAFAGNPDFDIMAAGNMRIWQSVIFTGATIDTLQRTDVPDAITLFAGGQMLIAPDSTLEADTGTFGLVADSFGTLDTFDGTVDIPNTLENDSFYNNFGDVDILSLSDLTIEGMNLDWTVYAGGSVNIQSDGILTLGTITTVTRTDGVGYDVAIDAGGDVTLSAGLASDGNLNVGNVEIYAGDSGLAGQASFSGGSINMNAGGDVIVTDSYLSAYSGEIGYGDVNIFGVGNVDIDGTYIFADGDVDIESGNSLTMGYNSSSEVYAGGSIYLTADTGDVYVDYDLYAGGDVDITSGGSVAPAVGNTVVGGNIDVEYSYIYAGDNGTGGQATLSGGSVNINAYNGDVTLIGDHIRAYSGEISDGGMKVFAGGDIGIYASTIDAGGKVNIEAIGTLNIGEDPQGYDVSITAIGSVTLSAGRDVNIYDTYVDAGGDVNISSAGSVSATAASTISGGGNIDVQVSDIYAGDNGGLGQASSTGGSVNINAYNGNVNLNGDGIWAYGGESTESGNVNVYGSGTVDVADTYIYADRDVTIEAGDTLTVGLASSEEIEAYGSVSLTSDFSDVHVANYGIYAYGGDIKLTANNGAITVGNSTLAANGSVYLSAAGDIDINNNSVLSATMGNVSTIVAISGDEVSISSGGTVTINGNFGDNGDFDYDIGADTKVFIQGSSEVDISDAVIKTLDGSSLDTVEIDSGGDVTLDSTDISSGGDVNINSGGTTVGALGGPVFSLGNVVIKDGSDVNANGTFNVNAAGNIEITYSSVEAGDSAYLTAGGYVKIYDVFNLNYDDNSSDTYMDGWSITAGSYVDIGADANVTLDSTDISSGGDVNINSGGTTVGALEGSVSSLGNVVIKDGSDVNANGSFNVNAAGNIDITYSAVEVGDTADLTAGGYVNLRDVYNKQYDDNSGDLYMDNWNNVTAGTYVDIGADNSVQIYASTIYANGGDADIHAYNGTADIENTYIKASVNVNIESLDTLTLGTSSVATLTPGNSSVVTIDAGGVVNLTSDSSDVDIYKSGIYAFGGDVDITATENVNVADTVNIYATGDVNINSGGIVSKDLLNTVSSGGNVDIENSYITAGFDYNNTEPSLSGGSVNINANNGDVYLFADGIYAHGGVSTESGNVNIYGSGIVDVEEATFISADNNATLIGGRGVTIFNSTINANDGDLTIIAGSSSVELSPDGKSSRHIAPPNVGGDADITANSGNVSIAGNGAIFSSVIPAIIVSQPDIDEESKTIIDPGSIDLIAVNTVTVNNSTLTAQGGHVGISGGGTLNISGSSINADAGYADITSSGSTVDIEASQITASADVNVESSGKLTVGFTTGNTIDASGTVSLKSDNGDADVYNYQISSHGANGTSISAAGNVNLGGNNNQIYAYGGSVSVTALGTMDVEGTYIYANGDVKVESSDKLTVGNTSGNTIYANGAVSLKSDNGGVDISNYKIQSYGANGTSISAGGNVILGTDDIEANNSGDVKIAALGASSTVDIEDTYIYAGGDVKVESGGTLTLNTEGGETIEGNGSVYLTSDFSDVDVNNYTIYSDHGTVSISAIGNADVEGNDIEGDYLGVSINAKGNVTVDNNQIYAYDGGGININSTGMVAPTFGGGISGDGYVDLENNGEIYAYDGAVFISAFGYVYSLNNDIEADNGNLEIHSYNGTIHIVDTYLYASDDVLIESSGTLTLGSIGTVTSLSGTGSTIEADGGVTLASVNGDVDIYNYNVYAYGGLLSINAVNGSVDIENSTLGAGSDSNISISGSQGSASQNVFMTAYGGNIEINAGNDLTILNTTFDLGGNISISSSSTITAGNGDVDITTGGMLSISAEGTMNNISGNKILGDTISISDSIITANNGSVNIVNNGGYSLPDPAGFDLSTAFNVDITGGSTITANSGNVKMFTAGSADFENSTVSANGSAGTTGNVTVNAGAGITVNGSSISGDAAAGTIALNNSSGQTTIKNGSSMQAFYLNVNSSDGILIDGTSGGSISGNTMNLTAGMGDASGGPSIAIQNEDLGNLTIVNVQSHTANFDNDNLSSTSSYNVTVWNHDYHINDGHVPGSANFNNDTLDHTTAIINTGTPGLANQSNNGGIVLGGSGAGIHIN